MAARRGGAPSRGIIIPGYIPGALVPGARVPVIPPGTSAPIPGIPGIPGSARA